VGRISGAPESKQGRTKWERTKERGYVMLSVLLPKEMLEEVDRIIEKERIYASRSELIRELLRGFIEKHRRSEEEFKQAD